MGATTVSKSFGSKSMKVNHSTSAVSMLQSDHPVEVFAWMRTLVSSTSEARVVRIVVLVYAMQHFHGKSGSEAGKLIRGESAMDGLE